MLPFFADPYVRQLIKSFYRTVDMCKIPVLPVMKSKQTTHNDSSSDDSQGFFEDSQGKDNIVTFSYAIYFYLIDNDSKCSQKLV